jgi:hypothetical protein
MSRGTATSTSPGFHREDSRDGKSLLLATPIPLNTTDFASGVSIGDNYKVTLAGAGKYNIALPD